MTTSIGTGADGLHCQILVDYPLHLHQTVANTQVPMRAGLDDYQPNKRKSFQMG